MNEYFSPKAKRLWQTIPSEKQEQILHNVWCPHCQTITIITKFRGREELGDLILTGVCVSCGENVTRLIETGETTPIPPPITLQRQCSTVKLDLSIEELWELFDLLVQHHRHDLVRRYLIQLHKEHILNGEEVTRLANHYQIPPPRFR